MTSESTDRQTKRVMSVFAHPDDGEFTSGAPLPSGRPDVWVDISETLQRKMQAISQHSSQVAGVTTEIAKEVTDRNRHLGESKGYTYAEAFKMLRPHCEICR